jgi:cell division protein ZapE
MAKTDLKSYRELVASGLIEADPAQLAAAKALRQVARDLRKWRPGGSLFSFLGSKSEAPRGLYIHGPVGSGKTMLMDMFHTRVRFEPRRRYHFHEFMAMVHDRIGSERKSSTGDPIPAVARSIVAEARLLCFDEMHVTDIADAMILGRLFEALFAEGVVVVATSNAHPRDLYKNGLNRALFLPFIDAIERRMKVLELSAAKDFRLAKLAGRQLYFSPLDRDAELGLRAAFERLTGVQHGEPLDLDVKGHKIHVPQAAMGVAFFRFADLCSKALGPRDYLEIARTFHTVIIGDIPRLSPSRRDEARRFINLIDTLYDARVCLIASAEAEPDELYPEGDVAILFERTASRLHDMRSADYLASRAERTLVQEPGE